MLIKKKYDRIVSGMTKMISDLEGLIEQNTKLRIKKHERVAELNSEIDELVEEELQANNTVEALRGIFGGV